MSHPCIRHTPKQAISGGGYSSAIKTLKTHTQEKKTPPLLTLNFEAKRCVLNTGGDGGQNLMIKVKSTCTDIRLLLVCLLEQQPDFCKIFLSALWGTPGVLKGEDCGIDRLDWCGEMMLNGRDVSDPDPVAPAAPARTPHDPQSVFHCTERTHLALICCSQAKSKFAAAWTRLRESEPCHQQGTRINYSWKTVSENDLCALVGPHVIHKTLSAHACGGVDMCCVSKGVARTGWSWLTCFMTN